MSSYMKKRVIGYIVRSCIALSTGVLVSMSPFMKNMFHQAGSVAKAVNVSTLAQLKKELTYTSANAVLTKDITLDGPLEINKHNATIDLNGHRLIGKFVITIDKDYCVFKIAKDIHKTTIRDSVGTGEVYSGISLQGGGLSTRGEVTVKGVKFTSCKSSYNGGTICAYNGSKVTLENCTITGSSGARGGGMYIEHGSTVTINNSTFEKCTSDSSNGVDGGAICNNGTLTLNNVTIKDNKTKGLGGGIYNRGLLTLKGKNTITGNKAKDGGGGVYNYSSSGNTMFIQDTLIIKDNKKAWGTEDNGADNVFLQEGTGMTVTGNLSSESAIYANINGDGRGFITKDLAKSTNKRVFYSDKGEEVYLERTDFEIGDGSDEAFLGTTEAILESAYEEGYSTYKTLKSGWDALAGKDQCVLKLVKDCEITSSLKASGSSYSGVTLDLNGHVLKRTQADNSADGEVIRVKNTADCMIKDSKKTGMITGGSNSTLGGGGAITVEPNGSCKLYDVIISGNTSYKGGGAIASFGQVMMSGGEIKNNVSENGFNGGGIGIGNGEALFENVVFSSNTSKGYGGAIYVDDGIVTLRNCIFTGNTASQSGGAVCVSQYARRMYIYDTEMKNNNASAGNGGGLYVKNLYTFIIGCNIHDNHAGEYGGGIFLGDHDMCAVNMAGKCVVDNNTSGSNVKSNFTISAYSAGLFGSLLGDDKKNSSNVSVGWLDPGSRIGINNDGSKKKDAPLISELNEQDLKYFFGDNKVITYTFKKLMLNIMHSYLPFHFLYSEELQ